MNTQPHENLILDTDSYKASHFLQYPEGTTKLFSYIESRGGRYGQTLFFGLQYLIKRYLLTPITPNMVQEAKAFFEAHGEPFPYEGWKYIATKLGGRLPIRIRAVAEGSVVPTGNVLMTIESTDENVPWVVSWLETMLLRGIWYPTTVATKSYYCKKVILSELKLTSDDPRGEISFKLHDFGARGVGSKESSGIGGMAHLVNFKGSDTVEGIRYANHYYDEVMSGFSIPAAEHSTMTILGREGELEQMRRMVQQFGKPGAIFACVSDSYDLFKAVESYWCDELMEDIKASEATLVIQPDSGNPNEINLKLLQLLERKVGMQTNMKGFKVLPKYLRLIQGDGNDDETSIASVLNVLRTHGYSASNIAFGMGGGLLQQVNRDTQKFAMKCSMAVVNGEEVEVFKDPITDSGKRSKKGKLDLVFRDGAFETVYGHYRIGFTHVCNYVSDSVLRTVYENGNLLHTETLAEIRARAEQGLL